MGWHLTEAAACSDRSLPILGQEKRFGAWGTECRTQVLAVAW